ncbi:hypothetical protein VNI00_016346 [Paramarasmius palmivorus]|uniref:Uncharacterized protein n=1 Tax=Paramarasmius palmivorus TaxID=297713 RepID=A0AAW0BCZ8_9AGAR
MSDTLGSEVQTRNITNDPETTVSVSAAVQTDNPPLSQASPSTIGPPASARENHDDNEDVMIPAAIPVSREFAAIITMVVHDLNMMPENSRTVEDNVASRNNKIQGLYLRIKMNKSYVQELIETKDKASEGTPGRTRTCRRRTALRTKHCLL